MPRKTKSFVPASVRNVPSPNGLLLTGRARKALISSETNYKRLPNARNSSNVSTLTTCVKMGTPRRSVGLINAVNDSFTRRLTTLLVACIVVKVNRTAKLSVTLTRTRRMVSYRVKNEKIGILPVGNDGVTVNATTTVRFSPICPGMSCLSRTGVAETSVSMCSNG